MGTRSILEIALLLLGCLVVNFVAFFVLFAGKLPKARIVTWILFFTSMFGVAFIFFTFFFPEIFKPNGCKPGVIVCAWVCLISLIISAFFAWLWLRSIQKDSLAGKRVQKISKIMIIVSMTCTFLATVESVNIRFKQDIEKEKIIEEPCLIRCTKVEPNSVIPKNGSLCGTLGMTKQAAWRFAKLHNLKYYHKGKTLVVIIYPGDEFVKVGDLWMPVVKPTFK